MIKEVIFLFPILNYPVSEEEVPLAPSNTVYISQLVYVTTNLILNKFLQKNTILHWFWFLKLFKTFTNSYHCYKDIFCLYKSTQTFFDIKIYRSHAIFYDNILNKAQKNRHLSQKLTIPLNKKDIHRRKSYDTNFK